MKFLTLVSTVVTAQEILPPAGPTRPATKAPEEPKFLRVEPKIYPRFSTSSPTKRVIETLITPASYKPYTQEDKKEEKKPMEIHVDPIPEEEKKEVYEGLTEAAEEQNEEVESTTEVKGYEASTEAAEEQDEEKEETKEGGEEKEKKEAAESKDSGSYLVCTYFATLAVIAMF